MFVSRELLQMVRKEVGQEVGCSDLVTALEKKKLEETKVFLQVGIMRIDAGFRG